MFNRLRNIVRGRNRGSGNNRGGRRRASSNTAGRMSGT